MNAKTLPIGISYSGIVHTDRDRFDVDARFRIAREAGVFDYVERMPPPGEIDLHLAAADRHGIPLRTGTFYYTIGRDEPLLDWHLGVAGRIGMRALNVQIMTRDADGQVVADEAVVALYLRIAERGQALGVLPCLEVHVNMWSEHFGRVARVAEAVERHGFAFAMTYDPSHVVFKIGDPDEQAVQGMRASVEAGELELDPERTGNVCAEWVARGYVAHAHARSAAPRGPVNVWARHPDGRHGRGIQYPFVRPGAGEWHSTWQESRLDKWKAAMRLLLNHHATRPSSRLGQVTTEFIPFADYGAGARYSILANNIACARWLRGVWVQELSSGASENGMATIAK